MGTTPTYGFPYPEATDVPTVHLDIKAALDAVEAQFVLRKAPQVDRFTAGGTWNKPNGCRRVRVRLQGAGGGGGAGTGAGTGQAAGGGGGAGAYIEAWFDAADLSAAETVTVGAAGAGSGTGSPGSSGGSSSFAAQTAGGGSGGVYGGVATTGNAGSAGGAGGTPTTGGAAQSVIAVVGQSGGFGRVLSGQAVGGHYGAPSIYAPGAAARLTAGAGLNSSGYGGGGAGAFVATTTFSGGDGAPGLVIVESFF